MKFYFTLFLLFSIKCYCQNQSSVWCLGDSAGIDFADISNPVTFASGMDGRGSCASISDSSGNLLFYADTRAGNWWYSTLVYNNLHQVMQNGDSIIGEAWYNELVIVPFGNNIYYLFSTEITFTNAKGLYYSIIDMNQNGGLGAVIQKNIQLNNFRITDCVSAIKHGNGRDWWVITKFYNPNGTHNNRFYVYLITPAGVSAPIIQNLGNAIDLGFQKLVFNSTGDKLMHLVNVGFLAEYDFDRCTGILSNQNIIYPEQTAPYTRIFWEGAYSPDNSKFYISSTWYDMAVNSTSWLLQYDLTAPNIPASSDTLFYIKYVNHHVIGGAIRLAPNGKIYYTCGYDSGVPNGYPYPDSVRNIYNENLGVVNYPDSLGAACDFQPFSFNLGGKRTYWGLPNNPNYSLGPFIGSLCDTLGVGIENITQFTNTVLFVFYYPVWQTGFINAKGLRGKNYNLSIFDLLGNMVFKEEGKLSTSNFTKDLNMQSFSKEMYVVSLETEKEKLVKKFIKN